MKLCKEVLSNANKKSQVTSGRNCIPVSSGHMSKRLPPFSFPKCEKHFFQRIWRNNKAMDNGGLGDMGVPGHLPKCQLLKNLGLRNYFFVNAHFKAETTLQNIHSSDKQNENKIKTQVGTRFTTNLGRKMNFK
jgi:hypothetical protein